MTILPKCDRFKKVTVLTDPNNPEADLIARAVEHGEAVHIEHCEDGFVYLIRLPDGLMEGSQTVITSDFLEKPINGFIENGQKLPLSLPIEDSNS